MLPFSLWGFLLISTSAAADSLLPSTFPTYNTDEATWYNNGDTFYSNSVNAEYSFNITPATASTQVNIVTGSKADRGYYNVYIDGSLLALQGDAYLDPATTGTLPVAESALTGLTAGVQSTIRVTNVAFDKRVGATPYLTLEHIRIIDAASSNSVLAVSTSSMILQSTPSPSALSVPSRRPTTSAVRPQPTAVGPLPCQATDCLPMVGDAPSGTTWYANGCNTDIYGTTVMAFDDFIDSRSAPVGPIHNCQCSTSITSYPYPETLEYAIQTVCDSEGYIFNGTVWGSQHSGTLDALNTHSCDETFGSVVGVYSKCVVQTLSQDQTASQSQNAQAQQTSQISGDSSDASISASGSVRQACISLWLLCAIMFVQHAWL